MAKKNIILIAIAIFLFVSGTLLGWRLESRARGPIEAELNAHQTRIAEYQGRISLLAGKLGETEASLEGTRDIINGLREQVAVERRTNQELLAGIGSAQRSFGGIASRANSAIGIVDACLSFFEEEEGRDDDTWGDSSD